MPAFIVQQPTNLIKPQNYAKTPADPTNSFTPLNRIASEAESQEYFKTNGRGG